MVLSPTENHIHNVKGRMVLRILRGKRKYAIISSHRHCFGQRNKSESAT